MRVVEFHPSTKIEVRRAVRRYRKVADAELARDFKVKLEDAADRVSKFGHSLAVAHVVDGFQIRRCRFIGKNKKRAECLWFDTSCARLLVNRIDAGCFAPLWRDDDKPIELTTTSCSSS